MVDTGRKSKRKQEHKTVETFWETRQPQGVLSAQRKVGTRQAKCEYKTGAQVTSGMYLQLPNATTESLTLLMCAASLGDPHMVDVLLRGGIGTSGCLCLCNCFAVQASLAVTSGSEKSHHLTHINLSAEPTELH